MEDDDYAARLHWLERPPPRLTTGASFSLAVSVENVGSATWPAGASEVRGSVMVGGAFHSGVERVAFLGGWAELPHALRPGERAEVRLATNAADLAPGAYVLHIDAVRLGVGFFAEQRGDPLEAVIEIAEPDASEALWQRGLLHCTNLWTPSSGVRRAAGRRFPLFAASGCGARLRDVDGGEYLDFCMGWGTATLGYDHPKVRAAVAAHLGVGPMLSLPHPLQVTVAERLCALLPGAERVLFGKNGSDVLEAALRIARAHTGREHVLCSGFHGFHDWYVATVPGVAGAPAALRETVHAIPHGDEAALRRELDARRGAIAALVVEPCSLAYPAAGHLDTLRRWTAEEGVVLVFDEIMSAFRLANGGAAERFGVLPDLMAVGKGIANGHPLAALAGRRALMDRAFSVGYGPTFQGEVHALAAADAALEVFATEPVCERLNAVGARLRGAILDSARAHGVVLEILGVAPRQVIEFAAAGGCSGVWLRTFFCQELLAEGILCTGTLLPSYAHTDADLAWACGVFDAVLGRLAAAVADGTLRQRVAMPLAVHFLGEEVD
jgi:glutamate-1-semialdehyde aminotransferase